MNDNVDPWFERAEKQKWVKEYAENMIITCERCTYYDTALCNDCARNGTIQDYFDRKKL